MRNWQLVKIKELCEVTSSKRIYAADYVSTGVPFYRGKEITERHKGNLNVSTELFISEEKFEEIKSKSGVPSDGDLLLTSVGTIGSVYVVKPNDRFYFKDGNIVWFRKLSSLDSFYLYYWLCSPSGKAELRKATIGSSQPALTIVLLKEMEIDLPPLPTQRKIAAILSAYDDLIENNLRRIKILEEMAQNLYREWFVKFRFPGYENAKFVDSPLGMIPEGWAVRRMEEVLSLRYGKALKKDDRNGGDIPVYGSSGVVGYHDTSLSSGPGIIVGRKGNVGSVFWSEKDFFVIDTAYYVESEMPLIFLYYDLQGKNFLNNDAAVPGLSRNQAYSLPMIVPPANLLSLFSSYAKNIVDGVHNRSRQNDILRKSRDLLLPKLVSGEVDVSDLDIEVPEGGIE